jgi:hypothetical protein
MFPAIRQAPKTQKRATTLSGAQKIQVCVQFYLPLEKRILML